MTNPLFDDLEKVLFTRGQIEQRIREVAEEISATTRGARSC